MRLKAIQPSPLLPTKVDILCRMNRLDFFQDGFLLPCFRKEDSHEKSKGFVCR